MVVKDNLRGSLLVALSGMLYGSIGYLGTRLFSDAHFTVANMLFWRFLIATLWMSAGILLLKPSLLSSLRLKDFSRALLHGAICYSGASAFYFIASRYIGTGIAMAVFFSFPVFVSLLAYFWDGWKITMHAFVALIAVMLGIYFIEGDGKHVFNLLGIFFAIIAALFYAVYVFGSRYATTVNAGLMTLLICMGNTIIFFLIASVTKGFAFPQHWQTWLHILAIGILATAIPIQLLLLGLRYIHPFKASILSVLEPVVTVVIGFGLLNESISYIQLIGIMTILGAAILIQFESAS